MARLLAVSDLHYPSTDLAFRLSLLLRRVEVDALILAGDFIDWGNEVLAERLLRLLRRSYRGPILAVWGNHEHYLSRRRLEEGWDSLKQLERLEAVLSKHGVALLGERLVRMGGVNIAGVAGWYDYGFGPPQFREEDYERCNPFGFSVEALRRCARGGWHALCPPWWRNDCLYVRLPVKPREYALLNAERLEVQLREAEAPVLVVLHHAPLKELMLYSGGQEDFDMAYAGSPALGEVLMRYKEKVAAVVYGHLHEKSIARATAIGGVLYVNAYPQHPERRGFALVIIEGGGGRVEYL